jgi:tetratricopeptide (TPR) repeat protein
MTAPASGTIPTGGPARRRRRWPALVLCLTVATGVALGVVYFRRSRPASPAPPAVDLTGADPAVVRAIESASAEVREAPRSPTAWGDLGLVLLAHDCRAESLSCFAETERLDPREPRWPYFQGVVLALRGDQVAALPLLRRAVDLWPGEVVPRLRLAETLLAQGQAEEAEPLLRAVLQGAPAGVPEAWSAPARLGLAQAAFERGDLSASKDALRACADSPFTRKAAHARLAEICQAEGDRPGAERLLAEAADWPDDLPWPDPFVEECKRLQRGLTALLGRGAKLLEQGRAPEASRLLGEATEDYPDSCLAWLGLGRARLQLGDYPGAERDFRKAVRLGPQVVEAHFYLGVALFEQGDAHAALASFRRATELKPDYALAHFNLGQCLKREGNVKGGVEAFQAAVRHKPHFGAAHRELGALLAERGQKAEAREQLRQAVDLDPRDAEARRLLERLGPGP